MGGTTGPLLLLPLLHQVSLLRCGRLAVHTAHCLAGAIILLRGGSQRSRGVVAAANVAAAAARRSSTTTAASACGGAGAQEVPCPEEQETAGKDAYSAERSPEARASGEFSRGTGAESSKRLATEEQQRSGDDETAGMWRFCSAACMRTGEGVGDLVLRVRRWRRRQDGRRRGDQRDGRSLTVTGETPCWAGNEQRAFLLDVVSGITHRVLRPVLRWFSNSARKEVCRQRANKNILGARRSRKQRVACKGEEGSAHHHAATGSLGVLHLRRWQSLGRKEVPNESALLLRRTMIAAAAAEERAAAAATAAAGRDRS